MARRIVNVTTMTPAAFADTTALTDSCYPFVLQGGTASQVVKIWELSINGQAASSSSPTFMILARDSTLAVTTAASFNLTDAPMDTQTAAITAPALLCNVWTTKPQRSATLHLLNGSLNAFGGVYFWRANRLEEAISQYGNAASIGETSLSAFTGGTTGAIGVHGIYEVI